jgi:hypothetical protein
MTQANVYESAGEYGGWSVRPSKTGWIISGWSRVQGERSGWVELYSYKQVSRTMCWDDGQAALNYNPAIAWVRKNFTPRIIRRGYKVQ